MKINKVVQMLSRMSSQEEKLAKTTNLVNSALERQSRTMGNTLTASIEKTNRSLSKTNLTMLNLRQTMRHIASESKNMFSGMNLSNLFAGYYLITRMVSALRSLTDVSDSAISTQARLGLYNQSQYTNAELYDFMYGASQRSRTALSDTSDLVNRILVSGAMTGPGSATESIRIAEIINKASIAGGSTREETQRALRQLAQGLSSGALQGDELRSIREQTPFLAQMLAEGLNKVAPELGGNLAIGDLKALGGEGELTSERILKAFSAMEETIDEKFNQMPRTFSQSMTQINNVWTKFIANLSKGGGALDKVNKIASEIADYLMSERGQAMLMRLTNSINSIADGLYKVWSFLSPIVATLLESGPVIETLIASLGVLLGMGLAGKIAGLIVSMGTMGKVGLAIAGTMLAVAGASTIASKAFQAMGDDSETANKKVQAGWDAMVPAIALVLNQIFWVVTTGIALVADAVIWAVSMIMNTVGIILNGVIAGFQGIGWAGAKLIDGLTNNKWDLSGKVEGSLSKTTGQISKNWNAITHPGELFENTLGGGTSLHGYALEQLNKGGEYWNNKTADAYMESWDKQSKAQEQIQKSLDEMSSEAFKYNIGSIDKINGEVEISSEDLKLLKDIASRDLLLSMTSVTPQANVTFGDVRETADVNKIMDVIEDMVENAFATSLVYSD